MGGANKQECTALYKACMTAAGSIRNPSAWPRMLDGASAPSA